MVEVEEQIQPATENLENIPSYRIRELENQGRQGGNMLTRENAHGSHETILCIGHDNSKASQTWKIPIRLHQQVFNTGSNSRQHSAKVINVCCCRCCCLFTSMWGEPYERMQSFVVEFIEPYCAFLQHTRLTRLLTRMTRISIYPSIQLLAPCSVEGGGRSLFHLPSGNTQGK